MPLKHSRIPLGRADMLASTAIREAHQAGLPAEDIVPVGGVRRFSPAVDGAVLLAVTDDARREEFLAGFSRLAFVRTVLGNSASGIRVSTDRGLLEVHVARPESAGAALVWHTGTRRHTKRLQARAASLDLRFANGLLERAAGISTVLVAPPMSRPSTVCSICRISRRSFAKEKTRSMQRSVAPCRHS